MANHTTEIVFFDSIGITVYERYQFSYRTKADFLQQLDNALYVAWGLTPINRDWKDTLEERGVAWYTYRTETAVMVTWRKDLNKVYIYESTIDPYQLLNE